MKKTLIALAALSAASSFAFAESNVTLYGILDGAITSQHSSAQNGNPVSLTSGFNSMDRWGIKGVEDLGNGYNVGFILETGFSIDDGTVAGGVTGSSYGFSRETKLYVQGGFGQLGFGRLGSLAGGVQSNNILTGWALGAGYKGGAQTAFHNFGRLNNAIAYVSPSFGGLKLSLEYSNGVAKDESVWSYNSHYYGIGAQYAFGGFTNSLTFEAIDNKGVAGDKKPEYLVNLGLGYDFGAIIPMFAYQYYTQSEGNRDHTFMLSAKVPLGGGTALIGTRYLFGKNDGATAGEEDKHNVWTINAAYEYPLSKRTVVYAYAGYAKGGKAYNFKDEATATAAGVTTNYPYYDGYQAAIGLKHSF